MDVSWMTKYIAEGLGTMLLVLLGNGTIAGVTLKGSKNEAWVVLQLRGDTELRF